MCLLRSKANEMLVCPVCDHRLLCHQGLEPARRNTPPELERYMVQRYGPSRTLPVIERQRIRRGNSVHNA